MTLPRSKPDYVIRNPTPLPPPFPRGRRTAGPRVRRVFLVGLTIAFVAVVILLCAIAATELV